MVTKKGIVLLLTFLIFSSILNAQSKFKQKLSWQQDDNVLDYKVEVENIENPEKNFSFRTEINHISFSLPAGKYRYRIHAFDFLGREAQVTEWQKFEITKALEPDVKLKENKLQIIPQSGREIVIPVAIGNITKDTAVVLVNVETGKTVKGKLITEASVIEGKEVVVSSKAVFPSLKSGNWKMKVTNPSGLYTESEPLDIGEYYAEQARIAAEKLAEEKRIAAEKLAEEKRIAAELKRLEEERLAEQKRIEEERLAEEKRIAAELEAKRLAELEQQRLEAERLAAEEKKQLTMEEYRREMEKLENERLSEEELLARKRELAERLEASREKDNKLVAQEIARRNAEEAARKEKQEAEQKWLEEEKERQRLAEEEQKKLLKEKNKIKKDKRRLKFKNELQVAAGSSFLCNLGKSGIGEYNDSDSNLMLLAKVGWFPLASEYSKLGLNIEGHVTQFSLENTYLKVEMPAGIFQTNIVWQNKMFSKKMFFNAKAGANVIILGEDVSYLKNTTNTSEPDKDYFGYIGMQGGISVLWNPLRFLTFEAGSDVDFELINGMNSIFIEPYLCAGLRF